MPYAIARWSRTPDTWTHEYKLTTNKTLISFNDTGEYKKAIEGSEEHYKDAVEKMSSYTKNGVAISSSSEFGSATGKAWEAFDDYHGTFETSDESMWAGQGLPSWLSVDFGEKKAIYGYTVRVRERSDGYQAFPEDWTLEGSDDKNNWTTIDVQTSISWSNGGKKEFLFKTVENYQHYRINVTSAYNNSSSNEVRISEMELLEFVPATPPSWQTVSSTLPTQGQFEAEGMDDLSVLNRQSTTFTQDMTNDGALGSGKKFSTTIDLKKYFDITEIRKV